MYFFDKKTRLVLPLPFFLVVRYWKYFLGFGVGCQLLATLAAPFVLRPPQVSQASMEQQRLALQRWRPVGCIAPTRPKDVEFCKNFKGLR